MGNALTSVLILDGKAAATRYGEFLEMPSALS